MALFLIRIQQSHMISVHMILKFPWILHSDYILFTKKTLLLANFPLLTKNLLAISILHISLQHLHIMYKTLDYINLLHT